MFQKIDFTGLRKSEMFGYAADVPYFKGRKKLEFKPGLNVLFGPNGCGKSTVLKMLAGTMCALQGGVSAVTEHALRETIEFPFNGAKHKDKLGLKIVHDGQPVVFCDPRQTIGLTNGAFDDDFIRQGMAELTELRDRSHGQKVLSRLGGVVSLLSGDVAFPSEIAQVMKAHQVNSVWAAAIRMVQERMDGSIEKGQPSILLDEPESNFSLVWASRLWSRLASEATQKNFQVIVATHSPFALGIPGANYIDFQDGYYQQVLESLQAHPAFNFLQKGAK